MVYYFSFLHSIPILPLNRATAGVIAPGCAAELEAPQVTLVDVLLVATVSEELEDLQLPSVLLIATMSGILVQALRGDKSPGPAEPFYFSVLLLHNIS